MKKNLVKMQTVCTVMISELYCKDYYSTICIFTRFFWSNLQNIDIFEGRSDLNCTPKKKWFLELTHFAQAKNAYVETTTTGP